MLLSTMVPMTASAGKLIQICGQPSLCTSHALKKRQTSQRVIIAGARSSSAINCGHISCAAVTAPVTPNTAMVSQGSRRIITVSRG